MPVVINGYERLNGPLAPPVLALPKGTPATALRCCAVQQTRLDMARIRAARRVIDPVFLDTPLYRCEALEPGLGCAVSIKLETANPVRSFKARGTEVVASLLAGHGSRAVVCASAGNLGQALAWSGRGRGLEVTVVASRFAPAAKLDRIRALDARLELVDGDFELARERAAAIARHDGIRLVEDSLDIETCEGAATIGLELTGTAPSFDAVLIALGGGAMATGVGHVVKALAPGVEVICVQPLGAPAMTRSWRQRRVVTTGPTDTIADGVAGRRPIPAVLADLLLVADDAVLVQEASIIAGLRMLLDHAGLVVNRRPRSASRRSSKTVTASPAGTWSPSCAAATSTRTPIAAGSDRLPPTGRDGCAGLTGSGRHRRSDPALRTAPAACRAATRIGSHTGANGGAYPRSRAVISSTVIRFHSATAAVSIRLADPS